MRIPLTLLGLCSLGLNPMGLAGQAADSSTHTLRSVVTYLPAGAAIRLTAGGARWTGRVARRSPDSLSLTDPSGTRVLGLKTIDSLWVRGPGKNDAMKAGAVLGAVMFALLQISRDEGERTGPAARLGFLLFVGAVTGGALVDAASDRWVRNYPE